MLPWTRCLVATHRLRYSSSSSETGTTDFDIVQRPTSAALWVEDMWRVSSRWIVDGGLRAEALHQRLRIVRPCLPAGLGELSIRGLKVGRGVVDLMFRRRRSELEVEVEAVVHQGSLEVEVET